MISRAVMMLLMMLLTATTAGANVTVTYELKGQVGGYNAYSEICRQDNTSLYCRFSQVEGTNTPYWNANDTHGVDDEYDITFTPDVRLRGWSNNNNYGFQTDGKAVNMTVTSNSSYYIVSVTLKKYDGTVLGSATNDSDKSCTVSMPATSSTQCISLAVIELCQAHAVTVPDNISLSGGTFVGNVNGKPNYMEGSVITLTPNDADKVFKTFSVSGATSSSLAADKKSATVTIGSTDVTVTATLMALTGTSNGVTWRVSDSDGNGTYDRLMLSGSGTLSTSPWATDFASSITRVDVSSTSIVISGNPFSTLTSGAVIVVPTLAYAVGYASATFASKLRVAFGNQLFLATNEGGTPAYKIATEQDLRNLAAVINANTNASTAITGSGMTFRQTDDITLSQTFTPIGAEGASGKWFSGTYDGGDKTISGLTVNTSSQYAGLFGFVNKGTVKNVRLISPNVTNNYNSSQWNAYAGALAGRTQNSNVENCFVYNPNVSAPNTSLKYVGAIVGYLEISSYNTHFYSNADYAIAGYYDIGSLTNSGRARMVTLGSGVTGVSPDATAAENGFVYDSKSYYREGVTLTLASNPRAGYAPVFAANSTTFSGSTYTVSDGDVTFTFVENTPITYNITYNTNGGTMPDSYATTYNIESVNITLPTPTRKGYTFAGWYANEGLTDPAVTSITHGSTGDKQFWAKWTANTYTVQFDGNGNTNDGTMSDQSFTYDEAQNLTANTYTRAFTVTYNYNGATGGNSEGSATATATFNGWATSADGQKVYDDNQSVSNLADANGATVTLYAKWTDASVTLPTPTLTGYIFGGWYADSEWNTRLGYAGASYTPSTDITLYAKWTQFDWANESTGTETDPYVIYNNEQLDLLAQRVNDATGDDGAANGYEGKYFVLGADIAYRHAEQEGGEYESNYTAIGNGNTFCGNFDGRGHTVSGIRIYMGSGCQGLFGQSGGNIRGITLADARISGYINYDPSLGGIVGANSGTVSDCHVAATVTIRAYLNHNYSYKLGGIVGENKGTVSDCTSAATLTTNESSLAYHGGIAGYNYSGTLSHNLAIGAVVPAADDNSYGAICGMSDGGTLENNYYHACTVAGTENATGVGCGKADVTDNNGAVPAYVLTIGDGVDFLTAMADNLGFRYDSDGDGKAENYCPEGAKFTLNKAGYNGAEYTVIKTADNSNITGTAIIDNVLTMPGYDITVSFNGEPIDWANDGHSGTETDPYIIYNKTQLDKLAQRVNSGEGDAATGYSGKYFKLGADIAYSHKTDNEAGAATESNYTAIGNSGKLFCGHFDGQGHTVSGIRIYSDADSNQGLFGQTGTGANVHHVHLTDARIKGYENVGGIVGLKSGGTVSNCTVTETAITATAYYGTICGKNSNGTLTNNYYHDCTVAGVENATGKGCNNADVDDNNGAMPAFLVTPGEGITIQTPMADDLGFSYDSDGDGQDENYWRKGAQLILANQFANVPEGYASSTITVTKTANGIDITSNVLSGTTLTVPTADVTVTVTLTPIPWSGTGTRDDPWVISYASQLDLLAQRVNSATGDYEDYGNRGKYYYKYKGKYFVLGADITYNHDDDANDAVYASNYTAIGCDFGNQVCFFSGHFDGRGHTVSGIRIYKGAYSASIDQGLFGLSGGNIRGITLADARIIGYDNTGGIVGNNKGTVSDCHIAADVYIHAAQSGANYHGGIVGENGGTIDQCTSAATLTIADADNSYCYGGIVGENGGTLRHNLAIGATVPAAADNTYGAICGEKGGTLENNYYHACTVAGTENATSVGCNKADVTDGAEPGIILYDHSSRTDINSYILTTVGNVAVPRVALAGRTLYQDGDWNTLCLPFDVALAGSPLEGATVMELDNREGSGTGFDATTGILTLNFVDISPSGEQVGLMTAGRPYIVKWPSSIARTISSTNDWHNFAADVAGGNTYEGKVVRLADDIEVSEMVGTSEHKFKGTFDGQGHTLTLNDLSASGEACAPFRYVEGATIANLHTTGSVIADNNEASKFRSGLVGQSDGNTTILNSWSSVTISSGISGDGTHGGFIGVSSSGDATISNCRFDGSFSGSSTKCWGGFVGWSNSATSIRNSVFAPEGITIDQSGSTTFSRNMVKTTNCYYTVALNDFTNGATAIGTTSADDLAADLGSGWQVKDGKAVPVITSIGITDPVFSTVTIDDTNRDVAFSGGSFKGTYQTIAFDKEDQSILFLGAKNTLYYPQKGATINAFRAYFDLGGAHARQFVLNFGEETGISEAAPLNDKGQMTNDKWYTLDGVKLDGKPTKKGLYIRNGRKVVIK